MPKISVAPKEKQRPGRKPEPVTEFPEALFPTGAEKDTFAEALKDQMKRHGDTRYRLCKAVSDPEARLDSGSLGKWFEGKTSPGTVRSFEILRRIEQRYRLRPNYLKDKLPHPSRAIHGHFIEGVTHAERKRLAWHLPDDFIFRTSEDQQEILSWVREVIINGSTDYRRYQTAKAKHRFAIRFRSYQRGSQKAEPSEDGVDVAIPLKSRAIDAPKALEREMSDLLAFKTPTISPFGRLRIGVWGPETALQKMEHIGLLFGSLVAAPEGSVEGFGAPLRSICFALLIFPAVWDWYLLWRERRRGFFTGWEIDMLSMVISLVRDETGWIRQTPALADRLKPIPGLVTASDIKQARDNWSAQCDQLYKHARQRCREIERVFQIHRDPFEPILPILEADSPLAEYRKITDEILRLMPDPKRYPKPAAEAVRSFLMLRLGLHLGIRQRNLRELLFCKPGQTPRSEFHLQAIKCGELRWNSREKSWDVFIPASAFKNAKSSFFDSKPFKLRLPDVAGLYEHIHAYVDHHRICLLGDAPDPATLFVKTVKDISLSAAYDQNTFYEAWRLTIQRYGIYNPYTGRGAIEGILPHGPHNVRDVLATHIVKQTGSYEQASYAIQDTSDMVRRRYARFLPEDKTALAAKILNRVWEQQ